MHCILVLYIARCTQCRTVAAASPLSLFVAVSTHPSSIARRRKTKPLTDFWPHLLLSIFSQALRDRRSFYYRHVIYCISSVINIIRRKLEKLSTVPMKRKIMLNITTIVIQETYTESSAVTSYNMKNRITGKKLKCV